MCRGIGMGMRMGTLYNSIAWSNSRYSANVTLTQRGRTVTVVNIKIARVANLFIMGGI